MVALPGVRPAEIAAIASPSRAQSSSLAAACHHRWAGHPCAGAPENHQNQDHPRHCCSYLGHCWCHLDASLHPPAARASAPELRVPLRDGREQPWTPPTEKNASAALRHAQWPVPWGFSPVRGRFAQGSRLPRWGILQHVRAAACLRTEPPGRGVVTFPFPVVSRRVCPARRGYRGGCCMPLRVPCSSGTAFAHQWLRQQPGSNPSGSPHHAPQTGRLVPRRT